MERYSYQQIINRLESTINATEIEFYFKSDPETKYEINCFRMRILPFEVLIPKDNPNKKIFKNVDSMMKAKLFNGKSLKDRWDEVVITEIY